MPSGKKEIYDPEKGKIIRSMSRYGVPVRQICAYVGMSWDALRLHYHDDMMKGRAVANAKIGQLLYEKAIGGDTTAQIFWAKCQMGWNERQQVDHISSDGSMSPNVNLTKEQRDAIYKASQLPKEPGLEAAKAARLSPHVNEGVKIAKNEVEIIKGCVESLKDGE